MKEKYLLDTLSKRERQIMDVVFQLEKATAKEIMERLDTSTTNATVRKQLSILVDKGFLRVIPEKVFNRYAYVPAIGLEDIRTSALDHLVKTFFKGSTSQAMMALLKRKELDIGDEESQVIRDLIQTEREKGR